MSLSAQRAKRGAKPAPLPAGQMVQRYGCGHCREYHYTGDPQFEAHRETARGAIREVPASWSLARVLVATLEEVGMPLVYAAEPAPQPEAGVLENFPGPWTIQEAPGFVGVYDADSFLLIPLTYSDEVGHARALCLARLVARCPELEGRG